MNCARKHTLVTGSSSGIGRATALRLAAAGSVHAGVRKPTGRAQPVPPRAARCPGHPRRHRGREIAAATAAIDEHTGPPGLDGLVNNAGYGLACPAELVPLDAFRRQLDVNVTGQLAVTQAMLPALRRARSSIVMVSTIGVRFSPPFAGPLDAAKAALTALGETLRRAGPVGGAGGAGQAATINSGAADKVTRDAARRRAAGPRPVRGHVHRDAPGHGAAGGERQPARHGRRRHRPGADRAGRGPSTCAARTRGGWPSSAGCPVPVLDMARRRVFRLPAQVPSPPDHGGAGQQPGRWPARRPCQPGREPGHRVARPAMARPVGTRSPSASRRLVAWASSPIESGLRMNEP